MRAFRDAPIRKKILLIILLVNAFSLSLALGGFLVYDVVALRDEAGSQLMALAGAIGGNCAAALTFEDVEDATEVLSALKANESIAAAWVFTSSGKPLAGYERGGVRGPAPSLTLSDGCLAENRGMSCLQAVRVEGRPVGKVWVHSDLGWAHRMLNRHVLIIAGAFLFSLGCALLFSFRLQRLISGPLIRLAGLAKSISEDRDYSVRATKEGDDEIGRLVEAFNLMLEQIESQTQALESARLRAEASAGEAVRLAEATRRANQNLKEEIRIRKEIEEELRGYQGRLEEMVRDRTAQLVQVNECLSRENIERKEAEARLRVSLEEKGALLAEIHHRVKNNLQTISNLLSLTRRRAMDPEARQVLAEVRSRIFSMALIHERLYRSDDFNRVDMKDFISDLFQSIRNLFRGTRVVTPVIECEGIHLPMTQAIPCALVLNEAITNVYKHAYGHGKTGPCHITMRRLEGNRMLLRIRDEGSGMPAGVDIEAADTLGIKLMRNLVRHQLGGQLRIERNGGTDIRIEFEVSAGDPMRDNRDTEKGAKPPVNRSS